MSHRRPHRPHDKSPGFPKTPTHEPLSSEEKAKRRKRELAEKAEREEHYRKATLKLRQQATQAYLEEKRRKERERKREEIHRLLREEGWNKARAVVTPGFDRFEKWVKEGETLFLPPVDNLSSAMKLTHDLAADQSDRRRNTIKHSRWESWVDADDKRFPAGKGRVRELWYNPDNDEHFLVDARNFDDREPNPYREGENFWRVEKRKTKGGKRKTKKRRKTQKTRKQKRKTQKTRKQKKRRTRRHRR